MPVAPNPLLQLSSSIKAPANLAVTSAKAGQASTDKASSFADFYAKQNQNAPAKPEILGKSARDRMADKPVDSQKDSAAKPAVADSGKDLPAAKDKVADDEPVAAQDSDKTQALVAATTEPVQQAPVESLPAQAAQPTALPELAAMMTAAPVAAAQDAQVSDDFDPSKDPLADLPALRLALEHSAKAQGTTSAHASQAAEQGGDGAKIDPALVNGLTAPMDDPQASDGQAGGEQSLASLIDDGLKDVKGASSDTRIDDFASRLQHLTQAVTEKTASAAPVALPLGQPLGMQQAGWTEGLVNRVMYLSSQNLKSADIQLSPAELGRLDIRVDMTPDQPTQVTFTSGHVGVREALENQQQRLKEMFAEQGMGQLDVNVSDQSRQSQGEQQAQQGRQVASRSGRADGGSGDADAATSDIAPVNTSTVVLGTSAVDYYA